MAMRRNYQLEQLLLAIVMSAFWLLVAWLLGLI